MIEVNFSTWKIDCEKMASDQQASENDAEMIRECEHYVERNNIQGILKDAIVQICVVKPANPYKFLREHFEKLEKVRDLRHVLA